MKGCVFGNRMINLRVTNAKLYRRAIALVQALTGVSEEAGAWAPLAGGLCGAGV